MTDFAVTQMDRRLARESASADLEEQCSIALESEFIAALTKEPGRIVQTPGDRDSKHQTRPAFEVAIEDADDAESIEMLTILGLCAQGRGGECTLRASAWIKRAARKHAAYYSGDLAALLGEPA